MNINLKEDNLCIYIKFFGNKLYISNIAYEKGGKIMNDITFIVISMYVMIIANLIPINILAFENAFQYKGILIALNIVIFTLLSIIGFIAISANKNKNYKPNTKRNELKDKTSIVYNTTVNYNGEDQLKNRNKYLKDIDNYNGFDKWV